MARLLLLAAWLALSSLSAAGAATAASYTLSRTSIAGGGLPPSAAGVYTLTATLSQSASGPTSAGVYSLSAGFLYPKPSPTTDTPGEPVLPERVALRPARPNPARGGSVLAFDLPEASDVRLDVLSVDGRRVATLAARRFDAGRHQVTWRGTDDAGLRLAPGLYLVSFSAGSHHASQRLVLLDR